MPNKNYLKGVRYERKLVNQFREDGWFSIRSPGSKSKVDVIAIKRCGRCVGCKFNDNQTLDYSDFSKMGKNTWKLPYVLELGGNNEFLCAFPQIKLIQAKSGKSKVSKKEREGQLEVERITGVRVETV